MKRYFFFIFFLLFAIPVLSQIKVDNVKVFKNIPFYANNPAEAFNYFEHPRWYNVEKSFVPFDEYDICVVESLINNATIAINGRGRNLGSILGIEIYLGLIVTIDSIDHYFIIRDCCLLTEVKKGNRRKDYYFLDENNRQLLGDLAMKYADQSIERETWRYKSPVVSPLVIDDILCYTNSWNHVNPSNSDRFFERPYMYIDNVRLIKVEKEDIEKIELMLNSASRIKKRLFGSISFWYYKKENVLPLLITVDSLRHNFVLTSGGKIVEIVNSGEVYYCFKDNQDKQYLADFVKKYSVEDN